MSDRRAIPLEHRGVLAVTGEDARTFLQGLISNDINRAAPGRALWSALLTPQGRFLFEFFIVEQGGALLLEGEKARLDDLRRKLSMYKLRSKAAIALRDDLSVFALTGEGAAQALGLPGEPGAAAPLAGGMVHVDPRLAEAGLRAVLPAGGAEALAALGFAPAPAEDWDRLRLPLGLPDGSRDLPVDRAILLENGFEELHGVDFDKGCYMGQELTARTKWRGLVRKRLLPVTIDGPAPEFGAAVMLGDQEAGEMRSSFDAWGLALLRLETLAREGPLTCGAARLTPHVPGWAKLPEF